MMDKKRSRGNGIAYFLIGLPIGIAATIIALIFLEKCFQNDTDKTECSGFKSPEEAVCAYVDYLKNGDVNGMISTFAVESYAGHYNLENECDRDKMSYLQQLYGRLLLPGNDEFSNRLNIESRKNQLTKYIRKQYVQKLLEADNSGMITPNLYTGLKISDESDGKMTIEELMQFLECDPGFDRIKKVKVISPSDLKKYDSRFDDIEYFTNKIEDYNKNNDKVWNTDGIEHVIVQFSIDDEKYYLFMTTGCYDGKWYNLDFSNYYGMLLLDVFNAGYISESELAEK